MLISIAHKIHAFVWDTVCLCLHMNPILNGYGILLIFEMMWYATVSNCVHIFYGPITCSHKCFVILTFCFCFLFRFVFCLLAARCTSFFVSSSYSLYNYFCQHDQIFLKFRTDDDQNIVVNEKEKNKGEKKQHLHVPNKISLLNFWKWKNSEWQMNAYIIFAKQKPMTLCAQSDRKGQ